MALAGCILQANLNHSARAQDLLLQMAKHDLGIAAVAEPYRVPTNNGTEDITGTVALIRAGSVDSPILYKKSMALLSWNGEEW